MLKRTITPITELGRRIPEAGRIRMGVKVPLKSGKGSRPSALSTWRFTSQHRELIDDIAAHYGGTARPWHDDSASPSDQFEVITEASSIRVLVVQDGINIGYELWSGGGCKRRCDGVEVEQPQMVGDSDYEMVKGPCICHAQGMRECEPHTRLLVLLPEFSFAGAWRFESKGWNAAQELPGMYDMINAVHQRGSMIDAMLSIQSEERMTPTGKRNFKVPKLSVRNTLLEVAAGAAGLAVGSGLSAPGAVPALGAGVTPVAVRPSIPDYPEFDVDTDITEAEIVSDEELEVIDALKADAGNFGLPQDQYAAAVRAQANGDVERMRECSRKVRAGELEPLGVRADGKIQWR